MKIFPLFLLIAATAPAFADTIPLRSDIELDIQKAIETYHKSQDPFELNKSVNLILRAADEDFKLAQKFVVQESLGNDPALDAKNGLVLKMKDLCDQKKVDACIWLNDFYDYGRCGLADPKRAILYCEKAAELGSGQCNYWLGKLYYTGKDVEKDLVKARAYFEKAAEIQHFTQWLAKEMLKKTCRKEWLEA